MRTVGQILKEEREAKFYTLEEIEKFTKIRKELLDALEKGKYDLLPPATFVQGFIKNYAKFLKIDSQNLLAIFRREYGLKDNDVMEAFSNPTPKKRLKITPARVIGGIISLVILTFFSYLWFQYRDYVGAPKLDLTSPQDQVTVDLPEVLVEGKTDPDAKLLINNQEVSLTEEGLFKQSVQLVNPVNKITVESTSKFNKKSQQERTVYLKRE